MDALLEGSGHSYFKFIPISSLVSISIRRISAAAPLIPEGEIPVPVKLILGQNFRRAGSVIVFNKISKPDDFLPVFFQRNRDFVTVIQNESDGISGMNDRPVNSIGAAADGHSGQIVIGNQAEPTAGEH